MHRATHESDDGPDATDDDPTITAISRLVGRRQLLAGAGAAAVLASCGGSNSGDSGTNQAASADDSSASDDGDDSAGGDGDGGGGDDEALSVDNGELLVAGEPASLIAYFSQQGGFVEAGREQRLTLGVLDGENAFLNEIPEELTFRVVRDTGASDAEEQPIFEVVTEPIPTTARSGGLPRPYYSLRFTPPMPGVYQVGAAFNDRQLAAAFQVSDASEVPFPQIGEQISGITTPTVNNNADVDPICTRVPPCPFHEMSLDEAIGGDRPLVLMVSTPRFCQTGVCGPVLDLLMDDIESRGDAAPIVIHTEVFDSIEEDRATTQMVNSLSLTYEPALFVLEADGTIVDRLDNIFDTGEIAEAIDKIA